MKTQIRIRSTVTPDGWQDPTTLKPKQACAQFNKTFQHIKKQLVKT